MSYFFPEIDKAIKFIEEKDGADVAEWVRMMLDPLHHKMQGRTAVGPPSKTGKPVLVYADTRNLPISIPSSFDATKNFTIMLQIFEDQYISQYVNHQRDQNNVAPTPGSSAVNHGGVLIIYHQGAGDFSWSTQYSATTVLGGQNGLSQTQSSVESLAMVTQVTMYNDTPILNIGGPSFAARHNERASTETTTYTYTNGAAGVTGVFQAFEEFDYPQNEDQLTALPGFTQGLAKDGSMAISCCDPFAETSVPDFTHTVYESQIPVVEPNTFSVTSPLMRTSTVNPTTAVPVFRSCGSGIRPVQIRWVNVPPQTTGNVRIDRVVATTCASGIPSQIDQASLVRKATPYCSRAMNFLALMLRYAPAMQPSSANKNFSWLKEMFSRAGPEVADVLGGIPHPLAQAGSMALQFLAPRQATMGTKVGAPSANLPMPRNPRPPPPPPMGTRRPFRQTANRMMTTPVQPQKGIFDTRWTLPPGQRIMTVPQPVNAQTLKNRSKRQRQKANRANRVVVPPGGFTIRGL